MVPEVPIPEYPLTPEYPEYRLAEGILQIGVTKMAGAIKEISVEKGHDPRDYVIVPYGGAGPMQLRHRRS
jgi:N-methylhydantoinase A/oxoprolinase/acetone carboxylase beta subunit